LTILNRWFSDGISHGAVFRCPKGQIRSRYFCQILLQRKGEGKMTFEQYGALYGGDIREIAAAAVIDGKIVVVLRFGVESEVLEPVARANVVADLERYPFLHPDTVRQFFGDPDFVAELAEPSTVASEENGDGAKKNGTNGETVEDDEIAAGFAVLIDGEITYAFVCQHDIIPQGGVAKKDIEHVGPFILGVKREDWSVNGPALGLAVRAACEWAGGGPVKPCYFVSDSMEEGQLKPLGVVGEFVEVRFKFGRNRQKFVVLSFVELGTD
jgi:hypothetical protein